MHLTRGAFSLTQVSIIPGYQATLMALFRKGGMAWALEGAHHSEQMNWRLVMFSHPNLDVSPVLVRKGFSYMPLFSSCWLVSLTDPHSVYWLYEPLLQTVKAMPTPFLRCANKSSFPHVPQRRPGCLKQWIPLYMGSRRCRYCQT